MLRSRVIPCLLMHNKGLVKSRQFKDYKYVGDPLNAVKIFNEKEVDELMIIDIDATSNGQEPNYKLIKNIANECRMPLCYGGGIKNIYQAKKIIQLGVEKIAISSGILEDFNLINELESVIGRQSIVVVLDVKRSFLGKYNVYINNGKKKLKESFESILNKLNNYGVGEIVINSIDNDGEMSGYDIDLVSLVRDKVICPITVLGGAGSENDIINLVDKFKIIGAAAGSLFVFQGTYKAVLISYISKNGAKEILNISRGF